MSLEKLRTILVKRSVTLGPLQCGRLGHQETKGHTVEEKLSLAGLRVVRHWGGRKALEARADGGVGETQDPRKQTSGAGDQGFPHSTPSSWVVPKSLPRSSHL